jgi:hypothetical protein
VHQTGTQAPGTERPKQEGNKRKQPKLDDQETPTPGKKTQKVSATDHTDLYGDLQTQQTNSTQATTTAARKAADALIRSTMADFTIPSIVSEYEKAGHKLPNNARVAVIAFMGPKVKTCLQHELLQGNKPVCCTCTETIVTHPTLRTMMHASTSNAQGQTVQLEFADFTPVGDGCNINEPCTTCDENRLALKRAYYEHDRRVCPMADKQFHILVQEVKKDLGIFTAPVTPAIAPPAPQAMSWTPQMNQRPPQMNQQSPQMNQQHPQMNQQPPHNQQQQHGGWGPQPLQPDQPPNWGAQPQQPQQPEPNRPESPNWDQNPPTGQDQGNRGQKRHNNQWGGYGKGGQQDKGGWGRNPKW